ncbi:uncharacterized protein LOC119684731 isoform X2 [Teleopsis dalmanni]|uniref:uncharacterized protein LOC119680855 n=1 Tax=Teleopsis dalmanni TaxID=139649 RepID=UPI0018CE27C0|nr:uncharacterized protein LOC119680855 [Teleopsis dalmanni]XP_037954763.1 uncharacterized protein LOC119684731 isoform X2 [Teleopsis dalmanni]
MLNGNSPGMEVLNVSHSNVGYEDPDYMEWAWQCITIKFNNTYKHIEKPCPIHFSADELRNRWQVLKNICKALSKSYDLTALPTPLRELIAYICDKLDSNVITPKKTLTEVQKCILQNTELLESLPKPVQKAVEAELLEIILTAELNAKGTVALTPNKLENIDKECDEFMRGIQFHQLYCMAKNEEAGIVEDTQPNSDRFIPISEASKYVRNFEIRMKKSNLEDYLPLSAIKRECNK